MPDFWREDIAQLVESGIIKGTGSGLGLTQSEAKVLVLVKRMLEADNPLEESDHV